MRAKTPLAAMLLTSLCVVAGAAQAAPLGLAQAPDLHLIRLGAALLLCLMIALVATLLMKRFHRGGVRGKGGPRAWLKTSAGVAIVEARRLSPHADLCRIVHEGREYLIVVSPGGTTVLNTNACSAPEAAGDGA